MQGHGKQALEREIAELQAELLEQWLSAHADHCCERYPHSGLCVWPPPKILRLPMRLRGFRLGNWK